MPSCGRSDSAPRCNSRRVRATIALVSIALAGQVSAQGSNGVQLFKEAEAREATLRAEIDTRKAGPPASRLLDRARTLVGAYQDISGLLPGSPYSDDAFWHAGMLAADAFWEFGQPEDRSTGLGFRKTLGTRHPTSPVVKQASPQLDRLNAAKVAVEAPPPKQPAVMLKAIRREALPGAVRVTLELGGEAAYHDEQIDGPSRVFIDLENTRRVEALTDATRAFPDDLVRQIRVGHPVGTRTRVVLDLAGAVPHTIYALYNPYRVVIDFARQAVAPAAGGAVAAPGAPSVPSEPRPNGRGGFSLSRQLGLGVARIVIDPGHGGHDPGAMTDGLSEADLVLDVALRLEKLLAKRPGVEVVLTRRANVFVPLEERTAMANRAGADLFLSIHANASEDEGVRGIETYFLNFAPNPAAEAIAARENAASARTMRQLPDIVKAIALNNKLDESRDFASLLQSAMMERLKRANKRVKDLGVKQAPFVVLVGATMPSVLAEIAFLTNHQEATLLRGGTYRQQIAEALFNGVMRYQRSLKAATQTIASP